MCRIKRGARLALALGLLLNHPVVATAQSILTPVIKDQGGKLVGPVVRVEGNAEDFPGGHGYVLLTPPTTEQLVEIAIADTFGRKGAITAGFQAMHTRTIGWLRPGCTGTDLPYVDGSLLPPQATIPLNGSSFFPGYFPRPRATPKPTQTRYGEYESRCSGYGPYFAQGVPASAIDVRTFGFEEPFAVDLVPATSARRPSIVDSKGKLVGQYFAPLHPSSLYTVDNDDYSWTILRIKPSNVAVVIGVAKEGFVPPRNTPITYYFYDSANCSGPAYVTTLSDPQIGGPLPYAYVDASRPNVIMYADGPPRLRTANSFSYYAPHTCRPGQYKRVLLPLAAVRVDQQGFTPPFSVKMR